MRSLGCGRWNEAYGYDANSALTSLNVSGPNTGVTTTTLNTAYGYGYNAAGWTTSTTTISGTDAIAHDGAGRLTSDCGPQAIVRNTGDHCYRWTYDANGNVTSQVADNGASEVYSYSPTQPNEVTQATFQQSGVPVGDQYKNVTTSYGYDGNGDTTAITSPVNGAYTDTAAINDHLQYDAEQQPITLTHLEGGVPITISLGYNADGLRSHYTVAMTGTVINDERFQYRDGALAQVSAITATLNANGSIKSQGLPYTDTYINGPAGEPQEFLRQQGGVTNRYWYVLDGQGSVVAVTDASGKVVDRYNYDSWGEQIGRYPETVPQQLRYAGYWYDSEVEWYWLTTRYYNPEDLRFLQPDRSDQDGVHTYAYVGDDPVDETDPTGLASTNSPKQFCTFFLALPLSTLLCFGQDNPVYMFLIGDDVNTLGSNANFVVKGLALVDLASNVTLIVPIVGEETRFSAKAVFVVGRHFLVHDVGKVSRGQARRVVDYVAEHFSKGDKVACKCFPAGTLVATPHGSQAIESLHVGDEVLTEDPKLGKAEAEPVKAVIKDPVSPLIAVDLSDGSAITVTADHPFWVDSRTNSNASSWLQAEQLRQGDRLRTASGEDAVVVGLKRDVGHAVVYTLTVGRNHTYFVGSARVLVHNACPTQFENLFPEDVASSTPNIKLEQRGGKWVTVGPNDTVRSASGRYMYVRKGDTTFVARSNLRSKGVGHIDLAGGRPVDYAGEVQFANRRNRGTMRWWNNNSGHYQPGASHADQAGLPMHLFVVHE